MAWDGPGQANLSQELQDSTAVPPPQLHTLALLHTMLRDAANIARRLGKNRNSDEPQQAQPHEPCYLPACLQRRANKQCPAAIVCCGQLVCLGSPTPD